MEVEREKPSFHVVARRRDRLGLQGERDFVAVQVGRRVLKLRAVDQDNGKRQHANGTEGIKAPQGAWD